MAICPGCGREVGDKLEYPYCRYTPIINAIVKETKKNKNQETNLFEKEINIREKRLNTFLKILIIILVLVATGIGPVFGLIVGFALLESSSESNRSFGKLLMKVSIAMIILPVLYYCIILFFILSIIGL